jgi:hypothetical protein
MSQRQKDHVREVTKRRRRTSTVSIVTQRFGSGTIFTVVARVISRLLNVPHLTRCRVSSAPRPNQPPPEPRTTRKVMASTTASLLPDSFVLTSSTPPAWPPYSRLSRSCALQLHGSHDAYSCASRASIHHFDPPSRLPDPPSRLPDPLQPGPPSRNR